MDFFKLIRNWIDIMAVGRIKSKAVLSMLVHLNLHTLYINQSGFGTIITSRPDAYTRRVLTDEYNKLVDKVSISTL